MRPVINNHFCLHTNIAAEISIVGKFDLLNALLPEFKLEYTLASGMEELHAKFVEHGFSTADFEGDQFVRLRTLQKRLDRIGVSA